MRPARWRKEIAVGTAKTPRAQSFLLSFASFAPLRFTSPGPPKQAVHEAGANTRMHECARPGSARKSRLEPPRRQEREGFLLSFASFAPSRFTSPEPPKRAVHEAGANTRMHEHPPLATRERGSGGEGESKTPVFIPGGVSGIGGPAEGRSSAAHLPPHGWRNPPRGSPRQNSAQRLAAWSAATPSPGPGPPP